MKLHVTVFTLIAIWFLTRIIVIIKQLFFIFVPCLYFIKGSGSIISTIYKKKLYLRFDCSNLGKNVSVVLNVKTKIDDMQTKS